MPIRLNKTSGAVGFIYESPFVGPVNHTVSIEVDLSALTDDEIDADGYLKPAVPLTVDGALLGEDDVVFGVTVEEVKVADDNSEDTIGDLGTQHIAVALIAVVNQKVAEDILGRAYTADEAAGFAGTPIVLIPYTA